MKTILNILLLISLNPVCGQGQNGSVLNGILIDKRTQAPISEASVSIVGIDRDITTSGGEFSLNLRDQYVPGDVMKIFIHHPTFGSSFVSYTIQRNQPALTIEISTNTIITVVGTVKDHDTGQLLGNITVRPVSRYFTNGFVANEVTTDRSGQFLFYLDKTNFMKEIDFIDLTFIDQNGVYMDLHSTVEITSVISTELEKRPRGYNKLSIGTNSTNQTNLYDNLCQLSWQQLKGIYDSLKDLGEARDFKYALNNCLSDAQPDGTEEVYFAIQSSPSQVEIQKCRGEFSRNADLNRCLLQKAKQRLRFQKADHHYWYNSISDDVIQQDVDSNGEITSQVSISASYISPGAEPYGLDGEPFFSDDGIPVYVIMFKKID